MGALGTGERLDRRAVLHRRLGHRPALDGLRGLAVLIIVVYHANGLVNRSVLSGGFLGVDMFFVLSGFLITALLLQEQQREGRLYLGRFFGRRGLRLLPALYFFLVLHGLYVWLTGLPLRAELEYLVSAGLYFSNWMDHVFPNAVSIFPPHGVAGLGHLWSLSLEMQFYVVWPFVVLTALSLSRRTSTAVATLVGLLVAIVGYRWYLFETGVNVLGLYERTYARADALIMGALLAVLWLRVDLPRRLGSLVVGLGAAAVVVVFILRMRLTDPFLWKGGLTLFAAAVALLLFVVLSNDLVARALRWPPLVAVGIVSYGVYLWHAPVYDVVARYGVTWAPPLRVAVAALLTACFTVVSWLLVERPFLRRKAHLEAPGITSTGPDVDAVLPGESRSSSEVPSI